MKLVLKERFIQMVDALLKSDTDLNKTIIAEKMGVSTAVLSNHLNIKRPIPEGFIEDFIAKFSLNREFYETGIGNPLTNTVNPNRNNNVAEHHVQYQRTATNTPMYSSPATAGELQVYSDIKDDEPTFFVNIPQFKDCEFGKMIFGHSMYPTYESGSYVFCKRVEDLELILYGEVYFIETGDYQFIKRLQEGPADSELLAVSDNDESRKDGHKRYQPIKLKKEKIRKLYLVKGAFKQNQN